MAFDAAKMEWIGLEAVFRITQRALLFPFVQIK